MRFRAVVLLLLAGLAAGCGKGASEQAGASSASAIVIGVLVNETGPDDGENLVRPVMTAWASHVNDAGGVAGRQVDLRFEDTKADPSAGAAAVRRLVSARASALVVFDAYSEASYAAAITASGIPVIGGMGYDPTVWTKQPNWFALTTTYPSFVDSAVSLARELGDRSMAYVVCAEAPTCTGIGDTAHAAATGLGVDYQGTFTVAAATPDYTAECLKLKESGARFVALGHIASVNMRFAKTCATQGYRGDFGVVAGGVQPAQMVARDPGVTIHLALNAFPWWVDDAPVAAYRDLMKAEHVAEKNWADPRSTAAYATLELFRVALSSSAGTRSRTGPAEVLRAYGALRGEDLGGLLPQPVSFTEDKPAPQVRCYWIAQYHDGVFSGATLSAPTCDPAG